jgi:hypothetical protein
MRKAPKRSIRFTAYRDMNDWERQYRAAANGRVTVAVIKPPKPGKRLLRAKERIEAGETLRELMGQWRSTPFENEGAVTSGLRSSLCLAGHPWDQSDNEARLLVGECLDAIGAVRPTHEQGQREYAIRQEQCAWCYGQIPDELDVGNHAQRYCSDVCARSALQHRDFKIKSNNDAAYAAAMDVVRRAKMPIITCQECARDFRPTSREAKYCSPQCDAAGRAKALRKYPDRPCATCRTVFRPMEPTSKYCSAGCAYAGRSTFAEERECQCCGTQYVAKSPVAKFCSETCGNVVRRFRSPEFRPKSLTPRVFDYVLHRGGARITDVRCEAA